MTLLGEIDYLVHSHLMMYLPLKVTVEGFHLFQDVLPVTEKTCHLSAQRYTFTQI